MSRPPTAWVPVAAAPIPPRSGAESVWTGTRLVVTGGYQEGEDDDRNDGAALDPVTGAWSAIAARPAPGSCGGEIPCGGVWTGTVALFPASGLAYDPAGDRWSAVAPYPAGGRPGRRRDRPSGPVSGCWSGAPRATRPATTCRRRPATTTRLTARRLGLRPGGQRLAAVPGRPAQRPRRTTPPSGPAQDMLVWGGIAEADRLADGAAYRPEEPPPASHGRPRPIRRHRDRPRPSTSRTASTTRPTRSPPWWPPGSSPPAGGDLGGGRSTSSPSSIFKTPRGQHHRQGRGRAGRPVDRCRSSPVWSGPSPGTWSTYYLGPAELLVPRPGRRHRRGGGGQGGLVGRRQLRAVEDRRVHRPGAADRPGRGLHLHGHRPALRRPTSTTSTSSTGVSGRCSWSPPAPTAWATAATTPRRRWGSSSPCSSPPARSAPDSDVPAVGGAVRPTRPSPSARCPADGGSSTPSGARITKLQPVRRGGGGIGRRRHAVLRLGPWHPGVHHPHHHRMHRRGRLDPPALGRPVGGGRPGACGPGSSPSPGRRSVAAAAYGACLRRPSDQWTAGRLFFLGAAAAVRRRHRRDRGRAALGPDRGWRSLYVVLALASYLDWRTTAERYAAGQSYSDSPPPTPSRKLAELAEETPRGSRRCRPSTASDGAVSDGASRSMSTRSATRPARRRRGGQNWARSTSRRVHPPALDPHVEGSRLVGDGAGGRQAPGRRAAGPSAAARTGRILA